MQIQNEGYYLQLGVKDALLNALLVAAKRLSSGPPQVLLFYFLSEDFLCVNHMILFYLSVERKRSCPC